MTAATGRGRNYTAAAESKRHLSIKGLVLREGERRERVKNGLAITQSVIQHYVNLVKLFNWTCLLLLVTMTTLRGEPL